MKRLPPLLGLCLTGLLIGCDTGEDDQDPRYQQVAGAYEATTFTAYNFDAACTYYNALQDSGYFELTLHESGARVSGQYYSGQSNDAEQACIPTGIPEAAIEGTYSFAGAALKLNLTTSCEQRWHQSSWLIEDSTLLYIGFDVGKGPCMPEVVLQIPAEEGE